MKSEYEALLSQHTWDLVPLPSNRKPVWCKWVFRIKNNLDGSINKYKARLVAKGFTQVPGFDYKETFSPVIKPVTIRIILTLTLTNGWDLFHLDVNNAFLNSSLDETDYMIQPPGFESSDKSLFCRLNKALYGSKQASRQWFDKLHSTFLSLGFQETKYDPSLFFFQQHSHTIYILVYVDDISIIGSFADLIQRLTTRLHHSFALKQLGKLNYFLGIEIQYHSSSSIVLTQGKCLRDLLHKTNMIDAHSTSTPMASSSKLSKVGSPPFSNPTLYRSVVGSLQYATITHPEISYVVNKVCQFLSHPLESHWIAVKRILRYLCGTTSFGLHLRAASPSVPYSFTALCDVDWASDIDDKKSTSGATIFLGPNLISRWSRKQRVIARSSTEAEYRSLAQTSTELSWRIQALLKELNILVSTPIVHYDNQSAVAIAHNLVFHSKTKHMEIDVFFVREQVLSKNLFVSHIPSLDQWADALTKPLSLARFISLRSKLQVLDFTTNPSLPV